MSNDAIASRENQSQGDSPSGTKKEPAPLPATSAGVALAGDEEVRLAAEKVFRLHARLFEELAK